MSGTGGFMMPPPPKRVKTAESEGNNGQKGDTSSTVDRARAAARSGRLDLACFLFGQADKENPLDRDDLIQWADIHTDVNVVEAEGLARRAYEIARSGDATTRCKATETLCTVLMEREKFEEVQQIITRHKGFLITSQVLKTIDETVRREIEESSKGHAAVDCIRFILHGCSDEPMEFKPRYTHQLFEGERIVSTTASSSSSEEMRPNIDINIQAYGYVPTVSVSALHIKDLQKPLEEIFEEEDISTSGSIPRVIPSPFSQVIGETQVGTQKFQVAEIDLSGTEGQDFLSRLQTAVTFFIDGGSAIDSSEKEWSAFAL